LFFQSYDFFGRDLFSIKNLNFFTERKLFASIKKLYSAVSHFFFFSVCFLLFEDKKTKLPEMFKKSGKNSL
jgi:hypothetical protein